MCVRPRNNVCPALAGSHRMRHVHLPWIPGTSLKIVARVFNLKLKELLDDYYEKRVFGRMVARAYIIEFQKRGLPHAYILLVLGDDDRITTPEQVQDTVWAYVPN